MLHKNLIRLVIVLAVTLLFLGLYSGLAEETSSRIYENVRYGAGKAKYSLGWSIDTEGAYDADEILDVSELVDRLAKGETKFDWIDWLDLDKTALFEAGDLDPKQFPHLRQLQDHERPAMPYEVPSPPLEQAMIGRLYCKWYLTSPFRVVHIEDPRVFDVDEDGNKQMGNVLSSSDGLRMAPMRQFRVENSRPELRHRQNGHTEPTEYYEASEPLVEDLKKDINELDPVDLLFPRLNATLFDWNPADYTANYSETVEDHALSIQKALEHVKGSSKYFHEVWLTDDELGYGVHYDWRFFRGILSQDEHVASTHVLARAWQQFAEQMGIAYWYAHGSLLGYYWNGLTMPWDTDQDIQMPIKELNRLAQDFNRTLIVQNTSEGYRKFLIDVAPFFVDRKSGNGENVIDARFVDVDTGTYIDITGLARPSSISNSVSCKNNHFYKLHDFGRLQRVSFEGYPALVPLNIETSLRAEYPSYSSTMFGNWKFNEKIRLWEFDETCSQYLNTFANPRHIFCVPAEVKETDQCQEKYGTCDQLRIAEYNLTADITLLHQEEYEVTKGLGNILDISDWDEHREEVDILIGLAGTYFRPFRNSTLFEVAPATTP